MLEIELDPLEKNREGALKIRKSPIWRYGFLLTTLVLWSASLPVIVNQGGSPLVMVLTAAGVLFATALVVWYVFANRVSGFHSAGLSQIALSRGTQYAYQIRDGLIQRSSDEGCKRWKPEDFVGSEIEQGYAIIIFRASVCYLPFRGAGRQQVIEFVREVEELVSERP